MNTDYFRDKWNKIKSDKGYHQRIDPSHPLDFFVGVNENGWDEILLITVNEPAGLKSGKSLEVSKNLRKDGRWALIISSVKPENQDIFARLCLDLFESSRNCNSEKEGLKTVINRFVSWQNLFLTVKDILTDSALKGLLGELLCLDNYLSDHYGWVTAVESWQGPAGADRDFVLPDTWFEVKTISVGKNNVSVSSLEQLDTDNDGYLVVVYTDKSASTDPDAKSVTEIINDIREKIESNPEALLQFEQKLVSAGYTDKPAYDDIFFRFDSVEFYYVSAGFPRLIHENVPEEITSVKYDISLPAISEWKRGVNDIWN